MSEANVTYNRPIIGLPIALFITFLVLKLTGVIAWSWLWVTAPLWIGLALYLTVVIGFLVCTGIALLFVLFLARLAAYLDFKKS